MGEHKADYAVTKEQYNHRSWCIPFCVSAQVAELVTLHQALIYVEKKSANICTDSRYAWEVAQDYGKTEFLTISGAEIKHGILICAIFDLI